MTQRAKDERMPIRAQEPSPRSRAPLPATRVEGGVAGALLHTQRTAGNAAVQRMLTQAHRAEGGAVSPEIESAISHARGNGRPLDARVRRDMEGAFETDFGGVRVHTDALADRLSRSLGATAFTTGQDVFFREGTYDPGSASGRGLLAHELTHVVQQSGDGGSAGLVVGPAGDEYEREADQVAARVVSRSPAADGRVQRMCDDCEEEKAGLAVDGPGERSGRTP